MPTRDEIAIQIEILKKSVSDLTAQLESLQEMEKLARLMISESLENINRLYKQAPSPYILDLLSKAATDYGIAKTTLKHSHAEQESIIKKIQDTQAAIADLELTLSELVENEELLDAALASIAAPPLLDVEGPTTTLPTPIFHFPPIPLPHHPEPTVATQPDPQALTSFHVAPPLDTLPLILSPSPHPHTTHLAGETEPCIPPLSLYKVVPSSGSFLPPI